MRFLSFFFFFLFWLPLFSQPAIEWMRCYGGSDSDSSPKLQKTFDGGYIFSASTTSNDGDVSGNHGESDRWLVKFDSFGNIEWQRCLGGSDDDLAGEVRQTQDGGYILSGMTYSNDGDVTGYHGGGDCWVVRLDTNGNIEWQKCYGGAGLDGGGPIFQTEDGGYIFCGATNSNDGDVTDFGGGILYPDISYLTRDVWIVKLDQFGNIEWQNCMGGMDEENAQSIQQTSDGGYVFAGVTYSIDGDVIGNHGGTDIWVVKLSADGVIEWQRCYGGSDWMDGTEGGTRILQTFEGGYVILTNTANENNGDVTFNNGFVDIWLIKIDSLGNIEWQKCFGGSGKDEPGAIRQTEEGGYIFAGETQSEDGDVFGYSGGGISDAWVVKVDAVGSIEWQRCFGTLGEVDVASDICVNSDGSYVVSGDTSGDYFGEFNGSDDVWFVKFSSPNSVGDSFDKELLVYPNPVNSHLSFKLDKALLGNYYFVRNSLGETVLIGEINGLEEMFSVSSLKMGIYTLSVGNTKPIRFVKE